MAEETQEPKKLDTIARGGIYVVDGKVVNANGEVLADYIVADGQPVKATKNK